MKKDFMISVCLLLAVQIYAQDIQDFVNKQMQDYPQSRLIDIYKSCFQDYMGAEHLVTDTARVKDYLDEELETTTLEELMPWYFEPCGTDANYYRVSLRTVKEGLVSESLLLDAFICSANASTRPSVASWTKRWHVILAEIDQMNLQLPSYENDKHFIETILAQGKYAVSHSPEYRQAYRPHYRIIQRTIFEQEIKPLLGK